MSKKKKDAVQVLTDLNELIDEAEGAVNTVVKSGDLAKLLVVYFRYTEFYSALDALRKRAYHIGDGMSKASVPEAIEKSGMDLVRVPEVARSFYPTIKYTASIVGDKGEAFEWLRKDGAEELITETVNAGTLSAYFKEKMLNEGTEPPEELFKFSSYTVTGMSKYTPKKGEKGISRGKKK